MDGHILSVKTNPYSRGHQNEFAIWSIALAASFSVAALSVVPQWIFFEPRKMFPVQACGVPSDGW